MEGKAMEDFEDRIKERAERIDRIITALLPEEEGYTQNLVRAMNYAMKSGGKKIRPILMEESFRLCGGTSRIVEPFMAAIEMIHTHSLIHDDLPAIDNDEFRRGEKTVHAEFGEAAAVLAGDALLNYAYETAFRSFSMSDGDEDLQRMARALTILAEKSGIQGMLGGQGVDVENDKRSDVRMTKERLDFIYEYKTAALLEAPLMIGAVLAGAAREKVSVMEKIGSKIGLAFQIQDDILDVTGDEQMIGKPVHSDEENEKVTSVTYLGLEKAEEKVMELTGEANALLAALPGDHSFLQELVKWLASRKQ
jgi:geranylgeranyl diphosphate synthase type II